MTEQMNAEERAHKIFHENTYSFFEQDMADYSESGYSVKKLFIDLRELFVQLERETIKELTSHGESERAKALREVLALQPSAIAGFDEYENQIEADAHNLGVDNYYELVEELMEVDGE